MGLNKGTARRWKRKALKEILSLLKTKGCAKPGYEKRIWEEAEIDYKYEHYILTRKRVEKQKMEHFSIAADFDYSKIVGLSNESRKNLKKFARQAWGKQGVFREFGHQI